MLAYLQTKGLLCGFRAYVDTYVLYASEKLLLIILLLIKLLINELLGRFQIFWNWQSHDLFLVMEY